jgi:hypothetical protein
MTRQQLWTLATVLSVLLLARTGAATAGQGTTLLTPWGDPDLRGIWTNATSIPFERVDRRPPAEGRSRQPAPGDNDPNVSSVGAYNAFWSERGAGEKGVDEREGRRPDQTALLVDPEDGKLPPWTADAQQWADDIEAVRRLERPVSWVDLNPYDRCITRGVPGAMMPGFYNHNYQIVQTPDHVAILIEMIHDVRIVPLDGRPHLGSGLGQWMGSSRGRWEGQTLVVETVNFNDKIREFMGTAMRLSNGDPQIRFYGAFGTPTLTLVERFTRTDADTIDYRFTVTDPATYAGSWTVAAPMARIEGPVFEYACHEGNYSMPNVLQAARAQEQSPDQ